MSEANYTAATEILKERLGRIQAIILAHMESLLQLPVCAGDRSSHLCLVYDKIKVNVRGLKALGVRAEQYGSFLIPIIMAKLPSEVRLQIAIFLALTVLPRTFNVHYAQFFCFLCGLKIS